jgi:hypothetical protein
MARTSKAVQEVNGILVPQKLAAFVTNKYVTWRGDRRVWEKDMKELRNYIFQTDTTQTTNSKLPWKNKTTVPKLCQLRDNLHATRERLATLRKADAILLEELRRHGLYDAIWQAFAVFLPVQSVGVMGDERTYENAIALRCVTSADAMTADWARLPYDALATISNRITNEVKGVNRVVYDVSSKPPATIEWE